MMFIAISGLFAQKKAKSSSEGFPIPPNTSTRLFYLQRSSNANTVVYDANFSSNRIFNAEKPLSIYWIKYAEKGQKEELNYIQRTLAYGVQTTPISTEINSYDMFLVSYKKRKFKITTDAKGNPMVQCLINGKIQQLSRIFVQVEDTGRLIPKVPYIELFGKDIKTGVEVYEKFKP